MLTLGNKLTLNSQPIYHFVNKYSIDFDGVDDRIITDGADTVAQPTTYSFWCKSSTTTANYGVFGHGDFDKGAFRFNHSNTRPLLYLGINYRIIWQDTPAQDDGEWHHWVVYADTNDITNSKLYVDGVLQPVYTTTLSGSLSAYTESLTIGSNRQVGGNSFEGQIDEFAVYDRELTQDEITRMYNTYYSPNRVANGNFSQIGNEEVTNGDFSQEGSEQVTNGDFATDSDWSKGSGWTISGGSANSDGVSGASPIYQNIGAATVGTNYKIQLDVSNYTSGTLVAAYGGTSATSITSNGSYTFYVKATSTDANTSYLSYNFIGSIDNVSVKEVGQDWTFVGEWTMGDDVATNTRNAAGFDPLSSSATIVVGKQYKFKVNIISKTGGTLLLHNDWTDNNYFSTSGTGEQVWYFTATSTTIGLEFAGDGETIVVDNVSVKEVGQHWTFGTGWSMGDGVAIHDGSGGATTLQATGLSAVAGSTYKISYSATNLSGGYIKVTFGNVDTALQFSDVDFVGSITTTGSGGLYVLASANVTFDNLVVQELKHDATNLMLNAGAYQSASPLITSTKSMEFDGTDDYLEVGDVGSVKSMSFWFNPDNDITASSSKEQLFGFNGSSYSGIRLGAATGSFAGETLTVLESDGNFGRTATTKEFDAGRWYHIVIAWNETITNFDIYVDGVLSTDLIANTFTLTNFTDFKIGVGNNLNDEFNGQITEVGNWDRTLTALEVASLYNQGVPTDLLVNRNNYQSGNPTVFNTKQVDFDGTDDHLKVTNAYGSFTGSISVWVKRNSVAGVWRYITDFRSGSGGGYFAINNTHNIDVPSGTVYVNNVATTVVPQDSEWHHIVVTGIALDITESIIFGSRYTFVDVLNGEMSQVGLWNSTLTADEVSSLYNHGLPIDLTTDQAAYESSSNLVGYWRMGDGTLDSYPLIADQTNATLGSEQVVNGDFAGVANGTDVATLANWSNYNSPTSKNVVDNKLVIVATGGNQGAFYSLGSLIGADTYKLSVDVTGDVGASGIYISSSSGAYNVETSVGTLEFIFVASGNTIIFFRAANNNPGTTSYTNISIKQVNGNPAIMTNQTSSDIENGSPYADLVQNGDFATGDFTSWANNTSGNASIVNNQCVFTNASSGNNIQQTPPIVIGKTYISTFDIISITQGAFKIYADSGGGKSDVGKYSFTWTATDTNWYVRASGTTSGVIDNVTLEEVNTGLQGYWKMGDGTNDEYPVIYDQVDPTLSAEKVVDGNFPTPNNNWSLTLFTIANNKLHCISDGTYANAVQSNVFTIGKTHKVTFDITGHTLGEIRVRPSGQSPFFTVNANGSYTFYYVATNSELAIERNVACNMFLENLSIKEVQGNPATMTNMVEGNITNQFPLTKIRNYYRMGDGDLDGFPIIQDQTSRNLATIPTTNLLTYSEDFSNGYTPSSGVTISSNQGTSPIGDNNATKLTATGIDPFIQNQVSSTKQTFTLSIYAKGVGSSIGKNLNFFLVRDAYAEAKTSDLFVLTDDWVRYEATLTLTGTPSANVTFRLDAPSVAVIGDEVLIWGAQIEEQSQATAYIKSDGIPAVRKSTTTNLISYSEDFSNYSLGNATVQKSNATSPDGKQNSYKLIPDTVNTQHQITSPNITISGSTGDVHTFSVYVKADGYGHAILTTSVYANYNSWIYVAANLNTGVITANNQPSSIESVGNGWYRISVAAALVQNSTIDKLTIKTSDNPNNTSQGPSFAGNGTSGILVYGAQFEEQTQAETYAPTKGIPVTIDLFTENNYGTMTNMSANDIVIDTPGVS